eukprot:scaffold539_cov359-Prasinococcus_capsulatus_cf.AAC.14
MLAGIDDYAHRLQAGEPVSRTTATLLAHRSQDVSDPSRRVTLREHVRVLALHLAWCMHAQAPLSVGKMCTPCAAPPITYIHRASAQQSGPAFHDGAAA